MFEKDPARAEEKLMAVVKKTPTDVQAHLMLGAVRLKLGKHALAAEAFRDALRAEVNNRPAQVLLATALEAANDLPQALAAWQAVAKADPASKDAQAHVAKLADLTGETDVALDARRELVKLAPGSPETVADLAVYLSRATKHAEALRLFERANTLEPGFLEKHPVERDAYDASKAAAGKR
jgi:Tfp pilus assembly protein PilF